jgi:hypothetical protein
MRKRLEQVKGKRQVKSILLVWVIIAANVLVVFPLSAPKVNAQNIQHLASTMAEDGIFPYDTDNVRNNIVVWASWLGHHIMEDYTVDAGYTLDIPALNYRNDPSNSKTITFKKDNTMIEVWGKLITNSDDGNPMTRTLFWGEDMVNWKGIYFRPGSEARIDDCTFKGADTALMFPPGSKLIYPGINMSTFTDMGRYGVRMDGVTGYTNIGYCDFKDTYNSSIGLQVTNMDLKVEHCYFKSHGDNKSCLKIRNANISCYKSDFWGDLHPGNVVHIENPFDVSGNSNETIMYQCKFRYGASGDHLVRVDSSAPLFYNCSFYTKYGELSLVANEEDGIPAHPIIRNPSADGCPGFYDGTFDNTTMKATGGSSVTLQWFMDVFVNDQNGNLIDNAYVWVKDRLGNPAEPFSEATDERGWARWFIVTELTQYKDNLVHYSPFNVSALNNSMKGYTYPPPMMNMSKRVNVTVPFNPIPNTLPYVSYISTPFGLQSGLITIKYMLEDINQGDNGNLSVKVYWSLTGLPNDWSNAAADNSSDPISKLFNNTLYTFIWNSKELRNIPNIYNTTVYIMILPYDRAGPGTPSQTGNFTVDNKAPEVISGPVVTVTDTTALIEWTVNEPANASVGYGLYVDGRLSDITDEKAGSNGTTFQSVQLTGLQPGRNYTFVINSTDIIGNTGSSRVYTFETEIHIQLYKGWNMISIPPITPDPNLGMQPSVRNILISIAGQYDAVQAYSASDSFNDPWKHYRPGKPYGNDLTVITEIMGLWIHMKTDVILILGHKDPTTNSFFNGTLVLLELGWNFVSYPSVKTRPIDDALEDVPYDMVQTYDAFTHQWLSYDPGGYSTDTLTQMEMGRGYWIHCTAAHLWNVDYV